MNHGNDTRPLRVIRDADDSAEDLYSKIFDENPGLVAISDPETGVHYDVNQSWLTAFGYERAEAVGKTADELRIWKDPAHRKELVEALLHEGHLKSFPAHMRSKDGHDVHLLISGRVAMIDGARRLLLIGQDITELKQAQHDLQKANDSLEAQVLSRTAELAERLQDLLRSQSALEESEQRFKSFADLASDWYWETDERHKFSWLSQDTDRGALSLDIGLGKSRWDIAREDVDTEKWRQHRECLDAHQPFRNFEYQVNRRDGSPMWISVSGAPVFDEHKVFKGYRGTASDISDRIAAQDKIHQANRAKSDFLAKMSHELRTPLNAVIGFAELLSLQAAAGEPFSEDEAGYIDHIMTSGKHLLGLVNSLLDLSKIEAGTLDIELEEVALSECVDECIVLLKGKAAETDINLKVECRCNEAQKALVLADSLRLRQVMLNLISNAIKYNKPGGDVTVECQISPCNRFGRTFVSDTGTGIPETFQKDLFKPFARAESVIGKVEGSGIGLSITHQLVERMGGRLDFDSHEGMGTTFWVDFPLA